MKYPALLLVLLAAIRFATLPAMAATFDEDTAFLRAHTDVIVLSDESGNAQIAVSPGWQGRVLTSTAQGGAGRSFGWINRKLIASGKQDPHFNPYGGEDRIWLGPEGGQYSIFFAAGAKFDLADWYVPAAFDTRPFEVVGQSKRSASFATEFSLTNYSGTRFDVAIKREVRLLDAPAAWAALRAQAPSDVRLVAYESDNTLVNRGSAAWRKETGLLSIWILGMFTPSPSAVIAVPIKPGPEAELGVKVTANYFGEIPSDRLKITDQAIFLKGDGKFRSKIGINPRRSRGVLGSYDAENRVLTLVQFDQPEGVVDYVNSLWKLEDDPYRGDAENSYNDGPPAPGAEPMGPFFEMESSSPAAALAPGESIGHVHRTFHLTGPEEALDQLSRRVLGLPLSAIKDAFRAR